MSSMQFVTRSMVRAGLALVLVGALTGVSACAPTPEPASSPSAAPSTSTPEPYAGPLLFVGDELESFALTPQEVAGLFPGAPPATAITDMLVQYADGGGPDFVPAVCRLLITETSMGSIGARTVPWVDSEDSGNSGRQEILQFASEENATARMDDLISTVENCVQFDAQGPGSFTGSVAPDGDGVRAFAGTLELDSSGSLWRAHHAYAAVGNVIVHAWQPATDGSAFDAQAAAVLLRDRAGEAKTALVDELTGQPSVTPTPSTQDPSAAWSAWELTPSGVGPLVLGADRAAALAAVPGATAEEFTWTDTAVRLVSPDGQSSLVLDFTDDGSRLSRVTAGIANIDGDVEPDGSVLPAAEGVRIGAPLADAVAAFPEGTFLRIISSGEHFYQWATRDGGVIRFRADRDAADPAAVITGVTVEDATLTPPLSVD